MKTMGLEISHIGILNVDKNNLNFVSLSFKK
jgi:hypothetical protein